jgi:F0F1-type ATP synthase membrane subunit b/b'
MGYALSLKSNKEDFMFSLFISMFMMAFFAGGILELINCIEKATDNIRNMIDNIRDMIDDIKIKRDVKRKYKTKKQVSFNINTGKVMTVLTCIFILIVIFSSFVFVCTNICNRIQKYENTIQQQAEEIENLKAELERRDAQIEQVGQEINELKEEKELHQSNSEYWEKEYNDLLEEQETEDEIIYEDESDVPDEEEAKVTGINITVYDNEAIVNDSDGDGDNNFDYEYGDPDRVWIDEDGNIVYHAR